jgi:uncharacterized coiled-coil protein SlyX
MSHESKSSVLAAFDSVTVDAVRAEIAEHQTVIDGHQKQIDALREVERIVAKRDGVEVESAKRTWSRKKKEDENAVPVSITSPESNTALGRAIGHIQLYGACSINGIAAGTGDTYASIHAAFAKDAGKSIRKRPGTSPALWELVR